MNLTLHGNLCDAEVAVSYLKSKGPFYATHFTTASLVNAICS